MPGVDGFELYRRLVALDPSLASRYIFMSGNSAAADEAAESSPPVPFLRKPFTAADLDTLLAQIGVETAADSRG